MHRALGPAEVELKSGSPGGAAPAARRYALLSAADSDVSSASSVDVDEFGDAQKASFVDIRKKMDVGQVFVMIVHECVRHFRLNEALIIEQRDPRALHQARVAIRRLRTALTLFRPAIHQSSLKPFRKELRAFAAPFGDARNLDVFLDARKRDLRASDRRKVMAARTKAYDQVIETLKAQASNDLMLNLVEWTASGHWRKRAASAPIESFATRRLDAAWKKVRQKHHVRALDEQQLHRLRISVKKLRYAVDFLAPLYAKKRVRKFTSAVEEAQECLGLIHDNTIGRQIVTDLNIECVELTRDRSRQLRTLAKAFRHLKGVGRFWAD